MIIAIDNFTIIK